MRNNGYVVLQFEFTDSEGAFTYKHRFGGWWLQFAFCDSKFEDKEG